MTETQAPNNAALYLKLALIMGEVGNIPKTGKNKYFDYMFVTADAVADKVRDLLSAHKVAFFAAIADKELVEVRKVGKNGEITTMPRWVVTFEFTFADGESGVTVTQRWVAEADSTDDKLKVNSAGDGTGKQPARRTPQAPGFAQHQQKASAPQSAQNGATSPKPQPDAHASNGDSDPALAIVTAETLWNATSGYFNARPHFDAHWLKHQIDYTNMTLAEAVRFVVQLHWNYDKARCIEFEAIAGDGNRVDATFVHAFFPTKHY